MIRDPGPLSRAIPVPPQRGPGYFRFVRNFQSMSMYPIRNMREISSPAPGRLQRRALPPDWKKDMGVLDPSVLVVPFLIFLAMGFFPLAERAAGPRHAVKTRRFFCEVD